MTFVIALPPNAPDAVVRTPLNIRRAEHTAARRSRLSSPPRSRMSNLRPVAPALQARLLGEFFTSGHAANVPAVQADTLRQALAQRTPDAAPRSGDDAR